METITAQQQFPSQTKGVRRTDADEDLDLVLSHAKRDPEPVERDLKQMRHDLASCTGYLMQTRNNLLRGPVEIDWLNDDEIAAMTETQKIMEDAITLVNRARDIGYQRLGRIYLSRHQREAVASIIRGER